jgi:N4-(beta-N-acetylglucosaminyl)-L-asparaginase
MTTRRRFLKVAAFTPSVITDKTLNFTKNEIKSEPLVVSTWDFGKVANITAWDIISMGGRAIDAVEKGVQVPEADPSNQTVGYGGLPDRDGHVTLDACIMDEFGKAGSVCGLEHIMHPISVARLVLEKTPHVMLIGEGALKFALDNGFKKENLLTENSKKDWEEWLKKAEYKPVINIENHDTIGMLAMDKKGNFGGACTTSGLAYKMRGRVGDSPIIGAGLFVDNEIGAATSTGLGEVVLRTCGSFLVVELMRQGRTPQQACIEAVKRVKKNYSNYKDIQVGFLAINKRGQIGAFALQKGFTYAVCRNGVHTVLDADYLLK